MYQIEPKQIKLDQIEPKWIKLDQLMDDTPKSLTYIRRDLKFQNGFLRPQLDPGVDIMGGG